MAVCNLFKTLTKDTGNFLMFSQYADDLTKYLVRHNDAKAIPSRFIVMNVDYSKLNSVTGIDISEYNEKLPTLLQNYYENACAFFKDYEHSEDNVSNFVYTPDVSRNIFWNVFSQLLSFEDWSTAATETEGTQSLINTSENLKYIPEIVYRGDINIQSFTKEDNIGYDEIYCYIPNDAQKTRYCVKQQSISNEIEYDRDYVEGYDSDDQGFTGLLQIDIPSGTNYSYDESVCFLDENDNDLENVPQDDRSFNFNTIVVLYDIYYNVEGDDQVRYKDIPLGLYLTGTINNDGTVNNEVVKYVENNDIYGAGTSYGLRVATRFSVTPNATTIREISVDGGSDYAEFTKVMSSFSETQVKMDDILSTVNENELSIKNQLSSFKNYRTNIPYIVDVNGTKYWFVNGKNTNATVAGVVGPQGVTGPQGVPGQSIPGAQGVTGPRGSQGPTGPTGNDGSKYIPVNAVDTAFLSAGSNIISTYGFKIGDYSISSDTNTTWICNSSTSFTRGVSLRGATGVTGPRGLQGIQGVTGPTGVTGPQGPQGYVSGHQYIDGNDQDSIVEGINDMYDLNEVYGVRCHAEGIGNTISESVDASHVEGTYNTITYNETSSSNCHIEGSNNTITDSSNCHIEGYNNEITGSSNCHIEGHSNVISAESQQCHIEGIENVIEAESQNCHIGGHSNIISSDSIDGSDSCRNTLVYGEELTATNCNQLVVGRRNDSSRNILAGYDDLLVVGGDPDPDSTANLFIVTANNNDGNPAVIGPTYDSSGYDYAECMEWADGNPDNEDRVGKFVTLDGDKIKIANSGDDVIGVVSATSSIVGNAAGLTWNNKYIKDVYGRTIYDEVTIDDSSSDDGISVSSTKVKRVPRLNPDYDPTMKYVSRTGRKEWAVVGFLGQLIVDDDGSCVPGKRCTVADGGIATSTTSKKYRVLKRLDENHILILASFL